MKQNEEKQSGKEIMANFFNKASDIGKKVADNVQKGTQAIAEKTKNDIRDYRIKKYNPLFPKDFKSKKFHTPNIIQIVDDAERRNIDVCQGSMGWRSKVDGTEVMFLYDEMIQASGIQFVPAATCDAVYYVDNFDRNKYIKTDCIFSKAHEERLAELERIAYCLGAKVCTIEIIEKQNTKEIKARNYAGSGKSSAETFGSKKGSKEEIEKSTKENVSLGFSEQENIKLSGRTVTHFEGSITPTKPELKWFAHDENVKGLIEMRCSNNNAIKSRTLELEGASSATMSRKTACNLDSVLSMIGGGIKAKNTSTNAITMEKEATREHLSKLIYTIEF